MTVARASLSILVVTLALAAGAGPAAAQELESPRPRQGYYVGAGVHAAMQYTREDGDGLGPWSGWASTIRLGQLLTPRLGLGLAIDFGSTSGDGQTASLVGLGLAGQVELVENLALHAGVGLGVISLSDPAEDELRGGYGAGYTLALTYDWFPRPRRSGGFAITPGVLLRAIPSDTADAFAVLAGVEILYWTGLPRQQLDLPDSEAYASAP